MPVFDSFFGTKFWHQKSIRETIFWCQILAPKKQPTRPFFCTKFWYIFLRSGFLLAVFYYKTVWHIIATGWRNCRAARNRDPTTHSNTRARQNSRPLAQPLRPHPEERREMCGTARRLPYARRSFQARARWQRIGWRCEAARCQAQTLPHAVRTPAPRRVRRPRSPR